MSLINFQVGKAAFVKKISYQESVSPGTNSTVSLGGGNMSNGFCSYDASNGRITLNEGGIYELYFSAFIDGTHNPSNGGVGVRMEWALINSSSSNILGATATKTGAGSMSAGLINLTHSYDVLKSSTQGQSAGGGTFRANFPPAADVSGGQNIFRYLGRGEALITISASPGEWIALNRFRTNDVQGGFAFAIEGFIILNKIR